MMILRRLARLVDRSVRRSTGGILALAGSPRLRVLAFHGILDAVKFDDQLAYLAKHFTPVTVDDLDAALEGESLPDNAVWITFDDGDPTVIDLGLGLLDEYGFQATMFVCPGLIDTDAPHWWQVVEAAVRSELFAYDVTVRTSMQTLKSLPDDDRRRVVAEMRSALEEVGEAPLRRRQLTTEELYDWMGHGHVIGNHTWDHPLLDRCEDPEVVRQIKQADEWLVQRGLDAKLFAYPNGNSSQVAESVLRSLGYRMAVLFDHRFSVMSDPLRVSRLRVTAGGDLDRFASVVTGIHPRIHHALGRP